MEGEQRGTGVSRAVTWDFTHAQWKKSRRSGTSGACVELASGPWLVGVRDSKNTAGPVLVFSSSQWGTFVQKLKQG